MRGKAATLFLVGVMCGGGIGAGFGRLRYVVSTTPDDEARVRPTFEQRLKCKSLADAYAQSEAVNNRSPFAVRVFSVDNVDFSTSRNSCVATTTEIEHDDDWYREGYAVVDLLTKELLWVDWCDGRADSPGYCGNGKNSSLREKRQTAYSRASGIKPDSVRTGVR